MIAMKEITESTESTLKLTESISLANASEIFDSSRAFLQANSGKAAVTFDLSALKETDSSALSLFFALLRTAHKFNLTMKIKNPPSSMTSLADLYGVSDSLPFG